MNSQCSPASCQQKRDNWNVFYCRARAKRAAKRLTQRAGVRIEAFQCPHCQLWHVGKPAFRRD